jgi:glycosyltransferase involved in cell wall biosynthesis
MKIIVATPNEPGFLQYSDDLFGDYLRVPFDPLESQEHTDQLARQLASHSADLIHIQHEFGFMGSKVPGRYQFPRLVSELRRLCPQARIVATAHTVIPIDFKYPTRNRGWQRPFRAAANILLLPYLKNLWGKGSWGTLDGVIAHSKLQLTALEQSGCPEITSIPHYVPEPQPSPAPSPLPKNWPTRELLSAHGSQTSPQILLVFGYLTPEKAQDIVISAMPHLPTHIQLVLAGGIRRDADRPYLDHCQNLIRDLGLKERVTITGFISFEELDGCVKNSDLILLPFRETSGSGSLADLMTRRAPVLASDLPLNLEISERTPHALSYFKSEDPSDAAQKILEHLNHPDRIHRLVQAATRYAEMHGPKKMLELHLDFYGKVLSKMS